MNKNSFPIKFVLKYSAVLLLVILGFSYLSRKLGSGQGTLLDYEEERQAQLQTAENTDTQEVEAVQTKEAENARSQEVEKARSQEADATQSQETASSLLYYNGSPSNDRITYQEDFYYEPLSDDLIHAITGKSYPVCSAEISTDDLTYVHVLHYDFAGNPAEGELICNKYIAQDLVEIFYDLYLAEYQIEKITLIDRYDGDDTASMADNNTSCFNYRNVDGSSSLSRHAYGLAIDINPLYNPYIRYDKNGGQIVSPTEGEYYADRSNTFPYKIDTDDLCYRLFIEHGFTWGGNWNSCKDYQHFQKNLP